MKLLISFYLFLVLGISCQPQSSSTNDKTSKTGVLADSTTALNNKKVVTLSDFFIKTYQGTIDGQHQIEMTLFNNTEGNLNGYYFYKQQVEKLYISGDIDLDESFVLEEETAKGKQTGRFEGSIADLTNLKGSWIDLSTNKTFPFELKELELTDPNGWTGTWHYNDIWDGGMLVIGNVGAESFDFLLDFDRNGHLGSLFDKATITGNTASFSSNEFDEKESCEIVFTKHQNYIELDQQSSNFVCGFGARANASGNYENRILVKKATFSYGEKGNIFSTKAQHDIFRKLVGEHYEDIAFNFQMTQDLEIVPGDPSNARAFSGLVMGSIAVNEAIIMYTDDGKFWVASLGDDGTLETRLVRYFTTEPKQKNDVPLTLKKWLINFGPHALIRE